MKKLSYGLYEQFFKTLSNKTRFEIIRLLMKDSLSVNDISRKLKFEQSRVSHNLKKLECCGFLTSKCRGKQRIYSLDSKHMVPIINNIDRYIYKYYERLKECSKKINHKEVK